MSISNIEDDEIIKIYNIKDDEEIYEIRKIYNIEDEEIREIFLKNHFNVYYIYKNNLYSYIKDDELEEEITFKEGKSYKEFLEIKLRIHALNDKFIIPYKKFLYTLYIELIVKDIIETNGIFYKLKSNKYGRFNKKSMENANQYIIDNYLIYNNQYYFMYEQFIKNDDINNLIYINLMTLQDKDEERFMYINKRIKNYKNYLNDEEKRFLNINRKIKKYKNYIY